VTTAGCTGDVWDAPSTGGDGHDVYEPGTVVVIAVLLVSSAAVALAL
jgi:hypothetical protein